MDQPKFVLKLLRCSRTHLRSVQRFFRMGIWRNALNDVIAFLKLLIFGSYAMFMEACSPVRPLKDPIQRGNEYAVITGGNQGIGWFTIKTLVESGMKVIVGCRDGPCKDQLFKSIKIAGFPTESVEWMNLDLSSMDCVRAFGKAVIDKNVPISLLINNAGTMSPYVLTKDGFETQFAVNYLGHFLLTHLLLPRLMQARTKNRAARIVNLSSIGHAFGWFKLDDLQAKSYCNKLCAYSQSKSCLIMFTKVLHERLSIKNYPVKIYAIHPGIIRSDLWTKHWFSNMGYLTTKYLAKTEEQGAQRVVYAALSPQVENLSGNYFENSKVVKPIALARNRDTQQKLWEKSCQLLDISQFGGLL